jgi:hypothetical protein
LSSSDLDLIAAASVLLVLGVIVWLAGLRLGRFKAVRHSNQLSDEVREEAIARLLEGLNPMERPQNPKPSL